MLFVNTIIHGTHTSIEFSFTFLNAHDCLINISINLQVAYTKTNTYVGRYISVHMFVQQQFMRMFVNYGALKSNISIDIRVSTYMNMREWSQIFHSSKLFTPNCIWTCTHNSLIKKILVKSHCYNIAQNHLTLPITSTLS